MRRAHAIVALLDETVMLTSPAIAATALWMLDIIPIHVAVAIAAPPLAVLAYMIAEVYRARPGDVRYTPVGERAIVVEPLRPRGLVKVRGEYWRAMCNGCTAEAGEVVVVEGIFEGELIVRKEG